jgi:hypothetical protein
VHSLLVNVMGNSKELIGRRFPRIKGLLDVVLGNLSLLGRDVVVVCDQSATASDDQRLRLTISVEVEVRNMIP